SLLFMLFVPLTFFFSFFNAPATSAIYTLSLHDALPISINDITVSGNPTDVCCTEENFSRLVLEGICKGIAGVDHISSCAMHHTLDRKSTRLNSSHVKISYAVFCLKKKKNI